MVHSTHARDQNRGMYAYISIRISLNCVYEKEVQRYFTKIKHILTRDNKTNKLIAFVYSVIYDQVHSKNISYKYKNATQKV